MANIGYVLWNITGNQFFDSHCRTGQSLLHDRSVQPTLDALEKQIEYFQEKHNDATWVVSIAEETIDNFWEVHRILGDWSSLPPGIERTLENMTVYLEGLDPKKYRP